MSGFPNKIPLSYPINNAITKLNPLSYWPLISLGDKLLDNKNLNSLINSGSIPASYNKRKFNGSEYLIQEQKIVASGSGGTYRVSLASNETFFWNVGYDFSDYFTNSLSNKQYILILTDSAGKKAGGYIGGTGSGETLGDEAVINGNMETGDPPDDWNISGGSTVDGVADERTGGSGVQSLKVTKGTSSLACVYNATNKAGALYKCVSCWYKSGTGAYVGGTIYENTSPGFSISLADTGSLTWVESAVVPLYLTAIDTSFQVRCNVIGDEGNTAYYDDISILQVTDAPDNESIKLYSTRTGNTQTYAWQESGFNPNSISSWEIRRSDIQITDSITILCWVKGSAQSTKCLVDKYYASTTQRSFLLATGNVDTSKLLIIISADGGSVNLKKYESSINVFDNTWHMVGFTFTSNTLKLFVDGIYDMNQSKITDGSVNNLYDTLYPIYVGGDLANQNFDGEIGDIAIFNKILSNSDFENIYKDTAWKYI